MIKRLMSLRGCSCSLPEAISSWLETTSSWVSMRRKSEESSYTSAKTRRVSNPQLGGDCFAAKCKNAARNDIFIIIFLLASFISSCTSSPQAPTQIITAYATSAAQPWLSDLYTCASNINVVIKIDSNSPDIALRVGTPSILALPAYQIDEQEILIVTNQESPVQNLAFQEAQDLFAQGNASVGLWVYASDEDLQVAFDQLVMEGRSVNSSATLAVNVQHMSDVLNAESNSIGILPSYSKVENVREVFSAGFVPVLAISKEEPQGAVKDLIACLQK